MCGIIGIISKNNAQEKSLNSLSKLEYRGYDSAGLASVDHSEIHVLKSVGKLENLKQKYDKNKIFGNVCIGHTRWATHGKPSERNAHPIVSGKVAVVHNGIIENYKTLKDDLQNKGVQFYSDTDTEVVAHFLNQYVTDGVAPLEAVLKTVSVLRGAFSLGILFQEYDNLIIGVKNKSPLVAGKGKEDACICSDAIGLAGICDEITYLSDGEIVYIENGNIKFFDFTGAEITKSFQPLSIKADNVQKNGYEHFMLKEIMEQPKAIQDTLNQQINIDIRDKITIIACGTSYYAGCVAKYWFEKNLKVHTDVALASEYLYSDPVFQDGETFLVISQSGETSDTIAVIEKVRKHGRVLSIVNVPNSTISRLSDYSYHTQAGPEIGVAATKSFTTQLAVLAKMAFSNVLGALPNSCSAILSEQNQVAAIDLAQTIMNCQSILFLGRGIMYPIAMESALKVKELTYIHAEAFAAGELKHGPLAVVDNDVPVIIFAPYNNLLEKNVSTVNEVLARSENVFVVTDDKAAEFFVRMRTISLPYIAPDLTPFTFVIFSQLLAYHIARLKGYDPDKPRNLAKSVTVE